MIGVLPVDKPAGPTSHDVVASARRALRERRVGHTGTLDPFASGLLLLCIGAATRLAEFLSGLDKEYEASARIGIATDTLDHTGAEVSCTDEWRGLPPSVVRQAFEGQQGTRFQTPPAYSAKKVAGRRAYELARQGATVELEPVEVTIHGIDVQEVEDDTVRFRVRCSSGTYVRAIARDAGDTLGVGGHLVALRRTAVGPFRVEDAVRTSALGDTATVLDKLVPPLDALVDWPTIELAGPDVERVRHGQPLPAAGRAPRGLVALAAGGQLVAVAESDGETLRPRKVFA